MRYGELPKELGIFEVEAKEMMFYQYLPIKMPNETQPIYEQRLKCFDALVGAICCDYIGEFWLDNYVNSYVYLTAKHLYQMPNCSFNRTGWHSDGFLTDDINYIWCDKYPTIFNKTDFDLPLDDLLSMGHARALLGLESEEEQLNLAEEIINGKFSVRDTEQAVKRVATKSSPIRESSTPSQNDANIRAAELKMKRYLGTQVRIHLNQNGGKIEVEFSSMSELDRVYSIIMRKSDA